MNDLGINTRMDTEGGPTYCYGYKHTTETTHNGITYRVSTQISILLLSVLMLTFTQPTQAVFSTILNIDDGVLIGWHKFGPKHMGLRQNPPVTILPELKNWSDIAFLKWLALCRRRNRPVQPLKYIISAEVTNSETGPILQQILGVNNVKANCGRWRWRDRKVYTMDTPEGKALLGSPNGRGAALILIQHKNYFGVTTTISHVTFWCGAKDDWEVHLMFHVQP